MTERQARVLTRIFTWAWENRIEVRLDGYDMPTVNGSMRFARLTFSRNNLFEAIMFDDLDQIEHRMRFEWHRIAVNLCVQALNLEGLQND